MYKFRGLFSTCTHDGRASHIHRVLLSATALAMGALAFPGFSEAQQASADNDGGLEEVIVTARKREETLIEVPVAVSVLTGEDIEARGVQSLNDVALFTPGLSYFDSIQNQLGTPVIRGISQTNLNSPDRNVAVFFGGVYMSNLSATNLSILDVERIEVVKGPQSALYGRNAFNGAINYVPAAPTKEFASRLTATVGTDGRGEGRVMVSGPMGDMFRGRIAAAYNTFDGTWDNAAGGDDLGALRTKSVSGMLVFEPNESFSARFFGYYTDDWRGGGSSYFFAAQNCGPPGRPLSAVCGDVPTRESLAANPDSEAVEREVKLGALDLAFDFGPVALKSQTARYEADIDVFSDYDLGANNGRGQIYPIIQRPAVPTFANYLAAPVLRTQAVPLFTSSGTGYTETTSQELRLESSSESALRWTVGLFWTKNDYNNTAGAAYDARGLAANEIPRDALGFSLTPANVLYTNPRNVFSSTNLEREDEQFAYFGSADYQINDQWRVGAELRRDKEERQQFSVVVGPSSLQEKTEKYTTWRGHVDFALTPNQRFYASGAKGVISGYFNATFDGVVQQPVPLDLQSYDAATNKTYEIGWKASWLDRRLATEIAIYHIDYEGIQINATPPPPLIANLIQNIGAATSQGFELTTSFAITNSVQVGATYSYATTEFEGGTPDPGIARYCGNAQGLALGFCPSLVFRGATLPDVSGNQLPRSPNRLASLYGSFDRALNDVWSMYARADVSYTSSTPALTSPQFNTIPERTIANARIGVRRGPLDVALWGRNIFDEEYVSSVIFQPTFSAAQFLPNVTQGEKATFGLTASWNFGSGR
jgi:iron complex outermembrane recepter protein